MSATIRFDQHMASKAAGMLPAKVDNELRTRYRQLPVMLRTSGLAATLAYLVGKTDGSKLGQAYHQLATGIRGHLSGRRLVPQARTPDALKANMELLTQLGELTTAEYARAAAEVEALAGWLSRLADARFQADRDSFAAAPGDAADASAEPAGPDGGQAR